MRLFKKKIGAPELALAFFEHDQRDALAGYPGTRLPDGSPHGSPLGIEVVKSERLFFDLFCTDYFVFLTLGDSAERKTFVSVYWASMKEWLQDRLAPSVRERLWLCAEGPRGIPAELEESFWQRSERRMAMYAEATNAASKDQEDFVIASTFCCLCDVTDVRLIMAEAAGISSKKINTMKLIRSHLQIRGSAE